MCALTQRSSASSATSSGACAAVGIPASIQNLLNVTGMSVLNNFTASFGSNAVAAMGIAQKINSVTFQIALGASQGVMPLISYNYASGNIKRLKKAFFFTARIAVGFQVFMLLVYFFGADTWVRLFMTTTRSWAYGAAFLRGFCLALPFLGLDFLAVGVFQGLRLGEERLRLRHPPQGGAGDPRPAPLKRPLPLYGLALCPAHRRGNPGRRRRGGALRAVPPPGAAVPAEGALPHRRIDLGGAAQRRPFLFIVWDGPPFPGLRKKFFPPPGA